MIVRQYHACNWIHSHWKDHVSLPGLHPDSLEPERLKHTLTVKNLVVIFFQITQIININATMWKQHHSWVKITNSSKTLTVFTNTILWNAQLCFALCLIYNWSLDTWNYYYFDYIDLPSKIQAKQPSSLLELTHIIYILLTELS